MAALIRHGVLKTVHFRPANAGAGLATVAKQERRKKTKLDKKQPPRVFSMGASIAAKGFLRPQNSYDPPKDIETRIHTIFQQILGTTSDDISVGDLTQKFHLCSACAKEFDHSIPSSLLHTIQTLNDVKKFYQTPVDTITPLDRMRNMELPENLHVQFEYHRFHPDTDKLFKGQTAFNRSSTLVTGLKYKDKYKGYEQNQEWPFNS